MALNRAAHERDRTVAALGLLSDRSRVGHRPRGLQRRRRRLGLPPPRPGAQQGVPLGRGRHRRHLRPLPAPVLRARVLERPRPDPQGAALRPDAARGQPRRGRQGVLLPPRQHADALVHEVALQVSAGRVSRTRGWSRRTGAADGRRPEFELLDTGIFDEDRYFDIVIEYAKAGPEDICIRIEAFNRGPEPAPLHILPHLWFRNTWAWGRSAGPRADDHARARRATASSAWSTDDSDVEPPAQSPVDYRLGPRYLYAPAGGEPLFTDNETNAPRVYGPGSTSRKPLRQGRVPPPRHRRRATASTRRRSAPRPRCTISSTRAGRAARSCCGCGSPTGRRCRRRWPRSTRSSPQRKAEADEFYDGDPSARRRPTTRSASSARRSPGCSGPSRSTSSTSNAGSTATTRTARRRESRQTIRNSHWRHLNSMRVMSVPDKWEYPWFAAWDLAFQCVAVRAGRSGVRQGAALGAAVRAVPAPQRPDPGLRVGVLRPQPAGPRLGRLARLQHGPHPHRQGRPRLPRALLPQAADQLRLVGQQGRREGNNIFEGGFLGLDNITVVDRSEPLPRRRDARAVRRHRLDGHVLPEPDADRAGAGQGEPGLRGPGDQVLPALRLRRRAP